MRQDGVTAALVRMLRSCPDVVAWRKEVLVATRYVMTVMLRAGARCALGCMRHESCVCTQRLSPVWGRCLQDKTLINYIWLSHCTPCA